MSPLIGKIVPTTVVAAIVSYCAWPYLLADSEKGKPPAAMPEVAAERLTPQIAPPPKRDPFRAADDPDAKQSRRSLGVGKNQKSKTLAAKAPAAARGAPAAAADPLAGLTLGATCLVDRQRLAVIDGKIYGEGDKLAGAKGSALPWTIVRILPYKVILSRQGKEAELTYANVSSASRAQARPKLAASPAIGH
jgi:hypothetical protein